MASSMTATYTAGRYIAATPQEACDMAQQSYANSPLGRAMHDVGAYRFYTVSTFSDEDQS